MKTQSIKFQNGKWEFDNINNLDLSRVQLVMVFGTTQSFEDNDHYELLHKYYPNADIVGCSTAGVVQEGMVSEENTVATAIEFFDSYIKVTYAEATNDTLFENVKEQLLAFPKEKLRHMMILADGLLHNGDIITQALNEKENTFSITGGMAADGIRFDHTLLFANGKVKSGIFVMIGFYGESLHVQTACKAGWDEFGAEWVVTKSEGNIVHEINNKPAIELYKRYLGEYINQLPASGLLFPLIIKNNETDSEVLRVLMSVFDDGSLLYAGSIPQGSIVKLCKTNADNLIKGAADAASMIKKYNKKESLCVVISCMARKNVMKQLTDSELEEVEEHLGEDTNLCGFYSYGELSPQGNGTSSQCRLHNQTMTLTSIYED